MGRLTLNVLLSFAQFEREVTGERIRDKIAASKRKGTWMGGIVPLGYDVCDRRIVIDKREAETIRYIFRRYLELGCVRLLKEDLDRRGLVSKRRKSKTVIEPLHAPSLRTSPENASNLRLVRGGEWIRTVGTDF
jgi:DNA invertase Pin-like site-specific DNA recombinase